MEHTLDYKSLPKYSTYKKRHSDNFDIKTWLSEEEFKEIIEYCITRAFTADRAIQRQLIKSSGWKPENRSENDNGDINMPTISLFYGIIIYMYYFDNKEHKMPHIHANYAEYDAVISIPEGEVLNGEMPNKKLKLIQAWVEIHQEDLMANWKLAVEGQQPHKIEPLR